MSVTELENVYAEDYEDEDSFEDFEDDDESIFEEDDDDDDDLESLLTGNFDNEDTGEDFDGDDDDDDESLAERRFRRRRFPKFRRRPARFKFRGRPRFSRARGRRIARVRTPSGRITKVRLNRSFATAKDLNAFKRETKKAITNARKETKDNFTKLDRRLNKFTKTLDSKINTIDSDLRKTRVRVKKIESTSRMSTMLPMLMGNPQIESFTLGVGAKDAGGVLQNTVPITSVKYKDDNNMMLPLLLMSGSGGIGGGGDNSALLAFAMMK